MDPVATSLATNIRRRRKELGMTQAELAEQLDYSEKTISKWEKGNGTPPTTVLPRLAQVLKTGLEQLLYSPITQFYYLGIDGGGTKTEFLLCDGTGQVLSRAVLGSSNPNDVGIDTALEVLRAGILQVCGAYPMHSIRVFAGLAGNETYDGGQAVRRFLSQFGFAYADCGSDARSAVAASLADQDGVCVILGTGAVAYTQLDGKLHRFGGYGYFFGDECSGFALGRDAIIAALRHEDGTGKQTALYPLVTAACGTNTVLEHLGTLYAGGKRIIAGFAPLVFEAHSAGDETADRILQTHCDAVCQTIRNAAGLLDKNPVRVVFCGGLTVHAETLLSYIKTQLPEPRFAPTVCREPMIRGALRLAGLEQPLNGYHKEESKC